jgi:hypothetical protein
MNERKYLLLIVLVGYVVWVSSSCISLNDTHNLESQPTPSINSLIVGFSSSDVKEHAQAANQAGYYYDRPDKAKLVPYLVVALQEPDCGWDCSRVRAFAAQSIGQLEIYDEQAVEILISWLIEPGHSDDELIQAIHTIEVFVMYAPDSTTGLIYVMTEPRPMSPLYHHIQAAAANTLSKIGNPAAVPYLLSIVLSSKEPDWVRKSTAIALARYGPDATCAVPYLIPMLDSTVPDLRISAAMIISQATGNKFLDSEPENWDPDLLGPWKFEKQAGGEYIIVIAVKNWWQKEGRFKNWPICSKGLKGENVLP